MKKCYLIGLVLLFSVSQVSIANDKDNNIFIKCVKNQNTKDLDACLEKVGRIEWLPYKSPDICALTKNTLSMADNNNWKLSWKLLFMNERCHRLGEPFYIRTH